MLVIAAGTAPAASLDFEVDDALNINRFVREGPVAAHLLLRAGAEPRILVAFPAGNSGVGLWFEKGTPASGWQIAGPPRPIHARDAHGRPLESPGTLFGYSPEAVSWPFAREPLLERAGVLTGFSSGEEHAPPDASPLLAAGDVAADVPRTFLAALASGTEAGEKAARRSR